MRQCRHELRAESNYIAKPKDDGYRSQHLMFNYQGKGFYKIYNGKRIEVQIRTRLQHSWATAVEGVGLFRGEDLKGNRGSQQWLRLFKLMSAEFALAEGCQEPTNVPPHLKRVAEIKALDKELDAVKTLESMSHAVHWSNLVASGRSRPMYYLITYNNTTREVSVEPYFVPKSAVRSYDNAEAIDNKSGEETTNVVLVEADKLENMKAAYPNYFGDVQLFKMQLSDIIKGRGAREFSLLPPERVKPLPKENPNYKWAVRLPFRWPR